MCKSRVVERVVLHGPPVSFRELCARAVPPSTRYVVLDLDRTIHLGRNMGELLGWEVSAYLSYGPTYLEEIEPAREMGRFCVVGSQPLTSLRYLLRGARTWGRPGLFYLLWGKVAACAPSLRRHTYRRFGPDPVGVVQRVPQAALSRELSKLPLSITRELAARVFRRYEDDAICDRSDIAWLRERCPGVKIVISSASPQPMLEAAARALEVDSVVYSTAEEQEGYLGAPSELARELPLRLAPHHLSRPSKVRLNAGTAKLAELSRLFPELTDPLVQSVGITDTGYGEDHCWTRFFPSVVDINSTSPFPPIVAADARVQTIHSASVLTRKELRMRSQGDPTYLDPRRRASAHAHTGNDGAPQVLLAHELAAQLGKLTVEAETLSQARQMELESIAQRRRDLLAQVASATSRIETEVTRFNTSHGRLRREAWRSLRMRLKHRRELFRTLAQLERPLSAVAFRYQRVVERARARLDRPSRSKRHPEVIWDVMLRPMEQRLNLVPRRP